MTKHAMFLGERPARFRYSDQHLTLDRARRPWRTQGVNRDRMLFGWLSTPLGAPVSRLPGDLRCWVAVIATSTTYSGLPRWRVMFWPTHAVARMVDTHWPGC